MSLSNTIDKHVANLTAAGWEVKTHCHNIKECHAYVDFEKKQLWIHQPKAIYAAEFFQRIALVIEQSDDEAEQTVAVGMYQYTWTPGELVHYAKPVDGHMGFYLMYLQVQPLPAGTVASQFFIDHSPETEVVEDEMDLDSFDKLDVADVDIENNQPKEDEGCEGGACKI